MKTKIDIQNWKRRDHYEFFLPFTEPFHSVNVHLDITKTYNHSKKTNTSLMAQYLHKFMLAINATEAFRLRIEDEHVYLYDSIDMGMTILRDDETFAYSYTEFDSDFELFSQNMRAEFEATKHGDQLRRKSTNHMIHGSVLPWINFSGLTHARRLDALDSIPKITFGKITQSDGKYSLPVAVHVHHALVDGIDLGRFLEAFQNNLDQV